MQVTVYTVRTENGSFVCGPFKSEEKAREVCAGYSNNGFWHKCHVEKAVRNI